MFGNGVNIASRLQTLTEPDTICISQAVYQEVEKKLQLGTVVSLGRPKLKNIAQRFQVYALLPEAPQGVWQRLQVQRLKLSHRVHPAHWAAVVGLLLITATAVAVRYLSPLFPSTQSLTPSTQPLPLPDKPSLAVLPFVNMSGDAEQEHFSDGMTDTLITDLSTISGLFVIARTSVFTYKGKAVKVEAVSKELGVRYVVEGSVQKAGDRVRINTQLIDTTTGGQVWAARYDRELQNVFAVQDEIAQKIVQALAVKLTRGEQARLARKETNNVEAYEAFWRGEDSLLYRTQETNLQAQQLYERALELDPQYAAAYAGLAHALGLAVEWGWNRDPQTLERAVELAQKALTLDAALPTAHHVLGASYWFKGQHDQAIAHLEQSLTLAPSDAYGYVCLAHVLSYAGQPQEAIKAQEEAMRLNPHYPVGYLSNLGEAYAFAGRYEEAEATFKKALARKPDFWLPYLWLAILYTERDRHAEARAAVAEVRRINPDFSLEMFTRRKALYKDPAVFEREFAALRKAGLK